jgi:hypothetical protein
MPATELRDPRGLSRLGSTVTFLVNADVNTALADPQLPAYGSTRTFDGRNLVVVSRRAREAGKDQTFVDIEYGPPARQLGGDIEPSEPTYKAVSGDITFELIEVPSFNEFPATTEDGTPYIQYVANPVRVPRRMFVVGIRVNILNFSDTDIAAITSQVGLLHTVGSNPNFQFEGATFDRISADTYAVNYTWRGTEPYTPKQVPGVLRPTDPLPPHAEYVVIPGALSGSGINEIQGPPTFVVSNLYDLGDVTQLPGNPIGAL